MSNPEVERLLASVPTGLWIGGQERPASSTFDVLNPADDEVLISVGNATADDALAAYRWARAHAEELGADPGRVAVAGDSAGGNLAAVVSRLARDAGDPLPTLQWLIYPVTDATCDRPSMTENAEGYMLTADGEQGAEVYSAATTRDQARRKRASRSARACLLLAGSRRFHGS
jgi:acetyl esterase/lipase